jgi:hypothetical protein
LVLGFSVASLSAAPGNFCTDFSNLASSQVSPTSFVNGPKVPLLLINLSLLSTFSVSFISLIVARQEEEEEEEDENFSVAAQNCDALVTSLPKLTMRAYCYELTMLWYTW